MRYACPVRLNPRPRIANILSPGEETLRRVQSVAYLADRTPLTFGSQTDNKCCCAAFIFPEIFEDSGVRGGRGDYPWVLLDGSVDPLRLSCTVDFPGA